MVFIFSGVSISHYVCAIGARPTGVDLTVADVRWTDAFGETGSAELSITSGQPYAVQATLENIGLADSAPFSTDLYTDGRLVGRVTSTEGLEGRGTMVVSWAGLIDSETGSHDVRVMVDSLDSVAETNSDGTAEDNNVMATSLSVTAAEWTVAIYLDADNNLEDYVFYDIQEMADVGSSKSVSIVFQVDRIGGYSSSYGDWTGAKRFFVTAGMEPWPESAYEDLDEVNMGDAATLVDFASDAFGMFKSAKTCLVVWDHGGGWYKGCCRDETSSNDSLTTDEMRRSLTDVVGRMGRSVDVIAFDTCRMAALEWCYAVQDLCTDFVASEGGLPASGYPYDQILNALTEAPSVESEGLCQIFVDEFHDRYEGFPEITLSAFRVAPLCTVVRDALSDFADALMAGGDGYDAMIQEARDSVLGFDYMMTDDDYQDTYSADLYYFALEVASRIPDSSVQEAAARLMDALDDARIAFWTCSRFTQLGDIFGIVVFWPDGAVYLEEYTAERLSLDTTWDEFLLAYYT